MSFLDRDPEMQALLGFEPAAKPPVVGEVLLPATGGTEKQLAMQGAYDAASRFDRDLISWSPSYQSADDDLLPNKPIMDARVRDIMRNDAYAAAGADIWKDNIVGPHYLLNAKPNWKLLGLSEEWAEAFQQEVEAKFTLSGESNSNWFDASRTNTFTSMIRLAVGVYVMAGEVLLFSDWIDDPNERRPFKTALQLIDLDRLSDPPTKDFRSPIRAGVETDQRGKPIAYHIRNAPRNDWFSASAYTWERVPTEREWGRKNIIHVFEQMRPDQTRGVAKLVSALKESRIIKRFRDVVLQNAVLNATYAASIESDLPSETVYQALGGGQADETKIQEAITQYATGFLGAINGYAGGAKNLQMDGVRVPHLFPGTKLNLHGAGQGGPLGTEFEQSLLRYLSANLGVSYEQLSKDFSKTNYSSARAAMTETWKGMQSKKRMVADKVATSIYVLWLEEQIATNQLECMKGIKAPSFWEGINKEAYSACDWIGASRGQVDELKETQASVLKLKYGLSTREAELGKLGQDWRPVFSQLAREKKEADKLGLVFTEDDNMMNAATGAAREASESSDEKEDGSQDNANA